jgi:hypothetical protein
VPLFVVVLVENLKVHKFFGEALHCAREWDGVLRRENLCVFDPMRSKPGGCGTTSGAAACSRGPVLVRAVREQIEGEE